MSVPRQAMLSLAVAAWSAAVVAQADPAAAATTDLEALRKDWWAAQQTFRDESMRLIEGAEYTAALAAGDAERMRALRQRLVPPDEAAFARRALELANKHDDHGAPFVVLVARYFASAPGVAQSVAELLGGRYVMDPAILDFLAHPTAVLAALDVDAAFALLQRIDEAHEGGVVAAWAKYWFARSLVLFRKEPEDAPQVAGLLAAAERDAAGTLLAERIAAPRFERERLQVGLPVPELAGEDMEGKPLELSSYRGKVVVLCFWSFDNNVARGAVPVQAQLAKRLEGRPFALVGVCSDTNKAHYANRCKVYGVTWRSFWEGRDAQLGPFATRWNVRSLPMYFVIDHEGLIQFRGADVQQIERVVAPLVEAADKAAASAGR
jgi:hypothetical protein